MPHWFSLKLANVSCEEFTSLDSETTHTIDAVISITQYQCVRPILLVILLCNTLNTTQICQGTLQICLDLSQTSKSISTKVLSTIFYGSIPNRTLAQYLVESLSYLGWNSISKEWQMVFGALVYILGCL